MHRTLIAVIPPSLEAYFKNIIASLHPQVFSEILFGNSVTDFSPEIARNGHQSYVFAIASPVAFDVLKEFYRIRCPNGGEVEWVHSLLAGIDAYKPKELSAFLKAPMSNARGCYASILAEHVVMCCLYFAKQVTRLQKNHAERRWDSFANSEMRGKTVGIIGYGNIGRAVAQLLKPFGVKCIGHRRGVHPDVDDLGVFQCTGEEALSKVLAESDFIIAILPKTKHTDNLFRMKQFQSMKKSAVFINIGRGSTVHEDELCGALVNNQIAGAALDVFAKEPLPKDSKLWEISSDKLLLSSHNADISVEAFEGAAHHFNDLAVRYVTKNELPEYLVDLNSGY